MNILIIEAYTDANIGSGALVENSVRLLKSRFRGASIRVMAHSPDALAALCKIDAVEDVFRYPFGKGRASQLLWLLWSLFWMVLVYVQSLILSPDRIVFFREKIRHFLWADMVVSVGAERINDKFVKNILFSLYTYALVKRLHRTLILFPCTIGPFLYGWTRWLSGRVLTNVDLIFTRDDLSFEITRGLRGISEHSLINTSDVAVFQDAIDRASALELLGVDRNRPLVGISVMRWTYIANKTETPYSNYGSYAREMAALADALIEQYAVTVVFYPTNFPVHGCREDDVSTAIDIQSRMKHCDRTKVIEDLPTPMEFKGMLACSEINITTRMHACILSTGAGVPTISVNYLFKLSEYMNSLGLSAFSIDIEGFTAAEALSAFAALWADRPKWRQVLQSAIATKQTNLIDSLRRLDDFVVASPPVPSSRNP